MDFEPPISKTPRPLPKHSFGLGGYDLIHFESTQDRYGVYTRDPMVRGPFGTYMMFSGTRMECQRWIKKHPVLTEADLEAKWHAENEARKAMFA